MKLHLVKWWGREAGREAGGTSLAEEQLWITIVTVVSQSLSWSVSRVERCTGTWEAHIPWIAREPAALTRQGDVQQVGPGGRLAGVRVEVQQHSAWGEVRGVW